MNKYYVTSQIALNYYSKMNVATILLTPSEIFSFRPTTLLLHDELVTKRIKYYFQNFYSLLPANALCNVKARSSFAK